MTEMTISNLCSCFWLNLTNYISSLNNADETLPIVELLNVMDFPLKQKIEDLAHLMILGTVIQRLIVIEVVMVSISTRVISNLKGMQRTKCLATRFSLSTYCKFQRRRVANGISTASTLKSTKKKQRVALYTL